MDCIDVAEETWLTVNKDSITTDMAAAIFDAANRGVGIASCVAAQLTKDYEEYAGGKGFSDYLKAGADAGDKIAQHCWAVCCAGGEDISYSDMDEDLWDYIKKSAAQGYVPALALLADTYYNCDQGCCKTDLKKKLECYEKIVALKDSAAWNKYTIKVAELNVNWVAD